MENAIVLATVLPEMDFVLTAEHVLALDKPIAAFWAVTTRADDGVVYEHRAPFGSPIKIPAGHTVIVRGEKQC